MLFEARSHYHHEGVAVNRLSSLCLALEIVSYCLSLFGEPCPSLYKLEGRVTCGVLVGLRLVYLFLQVEYKFGSCFLVKEIFVIPFLLSRPTFIWTGILGLGPCRPSQAPTGSPMSLQARESSHQWAAGHMSRQSSGGYQRNIKSGRVIYPAGSYRGVYPRH